jgi:diacylglycerol kinase family enzyme|tara:strand:+ start:1345 stop:1635 length:291 start_codon:yes stop_codon:yes gene_type:complete
MPTKDIFDTSPEEQITDGMFLALIQEEEPKATMLSIMIKDLVKDHGMNEESVEHCQSEANRQYDLFRKQSTEGSDFRARLMYRIMGVEKHLDDTEN